MSEIKKATPAMEKKVAAVVSGDTKTKKKGELKKFSEVFISEDVGNVKSYILMDVLIPAAKKAISDIVSNGVDMLLYGEARHNKKSSASRVSYRSYYDDRDRGRSRDRDIGRSLRTGFEYDEIIFDNRGDAEAVLSAMEDIIDQYEVVSVGDLFDLANVPNSNYGINNYGWTDLRRASVGRCPEGYYLKLPRAVSLK